MAIGDLYTDLRDGIMLINLLEAISEKKVGPYNRNPRIGAQRLENQGIALNFIKVPFLFPILAQATGLINVQNEGLKLVNIGPEDLCGGNPKLILGTPWFSCGRMLEHMTDRTKVSFGPSFCAGRLPLARSRATALRTSSCVPPMRQPSNTDLACNVHLQSLFDWRPPHT